MTPSIQNSTRCTVPSESDALTDNSTALPDATIWLAVGDASETVGRTLGLTVNETVAEVPDQLRLSYAVAFTE